MKISKNALKHLISEEVKKLEKIDFLKENKIKIKRELRLLKEFDNYNYPHGADADPNAPWNQEDSPEYSGNFEIVDDGDNVNEFSVKLIDDGGGTSTVYLYKMLDTINANPEVVNYFEKALMTKPRPNSFEKNLNNLVDEYADHAEFDNYPEQDYEPDPDEYRDEENDYDETDW